MGEAFGVVWMVEALDESQAAVEYLAQHNFAAAQRLIEAVSRGDEKATLQPYAMPPLDETGAFRYLPVPRTRYVLFFESRQAERRLDVLHVLHERQWWPEKFN